LHDFYTISVYSVGGAGQHIVEPTTEFPTLLESWKGYRLTNLITEGGSTQGNLYSTHCCTFAAHAHQETEEDNQSQPSGTYVTLYSRKYVTGIQGISFSNIFFQAYN
jgi:hypothetical protein